MASERESTGFMPATDIDTGVIPIRTSGRGMLQVAVDEARRSGLPDVIEARMLEQPAYWEGYYTGDAHQQHLARRYSYSDRLRYYWPDPEVHKAQERLLDNLSAMDIPLPLLSQYLPDQYARVRDSELSADPRALVIDGVRDVLRAYARASKETSS